MVLGGQWQLLMVAATGVALMLGASPRRTGGWLVRRLIVIPLLLQAGLLLLGYMTTALSWQEQIMVFGALVVFGIPLFIRFVLGRGVWDAVVGSFVYDMLRFAIRWVIRLPILLVSGLIALLRRPWRRAQ